jgi:hypothetical protein
MHGYNLTILHEMRVESFTPQKCACNSNGMPTPVAAQSKAWVCGRSLAGVVGSNPAAIMHVCLL